MSRVDLGLNETGLSHILSVGPPPSTFRIQLGHDGGDPLHDSTREQANPGEREPVGPELMLTELFGGAVAAPSIAHDTEALAIDQSPGCSPGAFKVRIAAFGPNFEAAMHASRTFDVDIILSGTIEVTTETGAKAVLEAGDTALIPAARHAWKAGPEGCRMLIMMIGIE